MKFNQNLKPNIVASEDLKELKPQALFLYHISKGNVLIEHNLENTMIENKLTTLRDSRTQMNTVFDPKANITNLFYRNKLSFSFNGSYLAAVDLTSNSYTLFELEVNEDYKYTIKHLRFGTCAELEWCPYANIFAVTNLMNFIGTKRGEANTKPKATFSLTVCRINNDRSIETIYVLDK